ncbi:hypothetical protein [Streptomyces sp. NPDC002067]
MGARVVLVSVRVCDKCKRVGVETRRYTVTEEERTAHTDRCADHAGDLEGILEAENPQVDDSGRPGGDASAAELTTAAPEPAEPAPSATAKKTAAPKKKTTAPAKKAAAKKTRSRGARVRTVAEIEQSKNK